ncbi:adenine-specific DNA methylase [Raphidiopsis curvata NIES-932]|jgi:DNA adenine methylase|uniref:DNA adenine methylase n=1 Tax=Cylindrospermopsis raciborskii TaxID=77022 RepID=UPI000B5E1C44|nr:Dam family site-specific DNA-(adenine-N6)-methyltransferase [Cylindrospermopsis raciborskii]UJL33654.1 Dam family site-specific DNA-(adenine-N6)-methyltransferase [Cylindrospermopsis raciborskii Cr2010]UJS06080.1 Dam family site-specific DNA-(adenine-N6)-methyltransferase [Cylindrospermopsis raciborskii KLL07]BAZ91256.1 adenine-specific DNA methylase [Raphidiopsis curvata NIES-932]
MSLFNPAFAQNPKPFLKWVGGKTQLINELDKLISYHISKYNTYTYIEPFVGGGAVLFYILSNFPQINNIIINDINSNLISTYKLIKEDYRKLVLVLAEIEKTYYNLTSLENKQQFYLAKRDEFNQEDSEFSPVNKTALMLFLNKTCFNGLYRVNKKGKFNVPFGKYKEPKICNVDNIVSVHYHLQNVKIFQGDFTETIRYAQQPTLFYLDPPYKPINDTSAFTSYSLENFNDQDQLRLKNFCDQIHVNGHYFILSNSDVKNFNHENTFFDDLYQGYNIKRVKARRNINSKGDCRGELFELLISNF